MDARVRLQQIVAQDPPDKLQKFGDLIEELAAANDAAGILGIVEGALGEGMSLVARPLLQLVAKHLQRLQTDTLLSVATQILDWLKNRLVSFEEEDLQIREHLSAIYIEAGQYGQAARTLATANLEASRRSSTVKAEMYIRIAELYLQENDAANSEAFCTRAAMLMHQVDSASLSLRHRICHARIFDRKQKFLEAASRYIEVSLEVPDNIDYLNCAVTCAILAPAGPIRSRLLAQLCKDERIERCPHYAILKKMFMERFIEADEVISLEGSLQDHQKSRTDEGTVLQRALLEHNVIAASKIYKNMFLDDLGRYLGVSIAQAERTTTKMISEKRLDALVDQRKMYVHFLSADDDKWNKHIRKVCTNINQVLDEITNSTTPT